MSDAGGGRMKHRPETTDQHGNLKTSLVDMLNSKATLDELNALRAEKTNKNDTERQMQSLDILHKQLLQQSAVVLELIK